MILQGLGAWVFFCGFRLCGFPDNSTQVSTQGPDQIPDPVSDDMESRDSNWYLNPVLIRSQSGPDAMEHCGFSREEE
ncbi:hypothetical protein DBV39_03925 [Orrella marina]|uniref:Uncharacterized protein n=1 Tax=Orrella marina TaxID=2163011 RepID=A0A2R4XGW6_9BURK|nr:hypothetical protein DBV39_03925 [Orrella marina]